MAKYAEDDYRNNGRPVNEKDLMRKARQFIRDKARARQNKMTRVVYGKSLDKRQTALIEEDIEKIQVPPTTAGTEA